MDLDEFKSDINNLSTKNTNNITQIRKNVLLSYVSDATGCGHIRNVFPLTYLNALFGKNQTLIPIISPMFIWQEDILIRAKTILFQRQMSPAHYSLIRKYKDLQPKYGYKMVYDIDDFVWGHNEHQGGSKEDGVPSYNFGWKGITDEIKQYSLEIIKLMDRVTVSSEYLKYWLSEVEGITVPITVMQNSVPKYLWGSSKKAPKKQPIKIPRIIYTGSPTHYSNQDKLLGDFDNSYREFIVKNVLNGKINFTCMGALPWFFEGIKDKIQVIPWLNSYMYQTGVKSARADIAIGPLVRNNFNYSKSYIKYQESCAEGIPFIGSVFTNNKPSPYDVCLLKTNDMVTVSEIENLVFGLCSDVDKYNLIVVNQYKWMDESSGYLESQGYIQKLMDNYF